MIDLTLKQPAVETFLPREFLENYVSSEISLEPRYLKALGAKWRQTDFNISFLVRECIQESAFLLPSIPRKNDQKPVSFLYRLALGSLLDVAPFPNRTLNGLRNMGQPFYALPNVRV